MKQVGFTQRCAFAKLSARAMSDTFSVLQSPFDAFFLIKYHAESKGSFIAMHYLSSHSIECSEYPVLLSALRSIRCSYCAPLTMFHILSLLLFPGHAIVVAIAGACYCHHTYIFALPHPDHNFLDSTFPPTSLLLLLIASSTVHCSQSKAGLWSLIQVKLDTCRPESLRSTVVHLCWSLIHTVISTWTGIKVLRLHPDTIELGLLHPDIGLLLPQTQCPIFLSQWISRPLFTPRSCRNKNRLCHSQTNRPLPSCHQCLVKIIPGSIPFN